MEDVFNLECVREISRNSFSPPPKVDSTALIIRRKGKPSVSSQQHHTFSGLAEYALKYPHWPIYNALKGVFTAPQMKHLVKALNVNRDTPICLLTEQQWGIVFRTMIQYVERFRWPKARKR